MWVLLDPDRVFLRTLAVCAAAVPCEDPPEDLTKWAHAKIDLAIEQLVRADREAERTHPELLTDEERDFPLLTTSMMLEPDLVRACSVAFNHLDDLPRRAFFELMIEGMDVSNCIEKGPWDEDGLYDAIHTAIATLGLDLRSESKNHQRRSKT